MDEDIVLEDFEDVVQDSTTDNLGTTTSKDDLGTEISNSSTSSSLDDDEQVIVNSDDSDGTLSSDSFNDTVNSDGSDDTVNSDSSDDTNNGVNSITDDDLLGGNSVVGDDSDTGVTIEISDLFETNSVSGSYLNIDGYLITQDGAIYSDYILVDADTTYTLSNLTDSVYNFVCFYDSDYTFISGIDSGLNSFVTPTGCSYLIISCDAAIADEVILEQQYQEELVSDEEPVTEESIVQVSETVDYTLMIQDMQLSIDLLNENLAILTDQYVLLDEESQELVPVTVFNKTLDTFTVTETLLTFIVFFNLVQIARNIFRKRRNF